MRLKDELKSKQKKIFIFANFNLKFWTMGEKHKGGSMIDTAITYRIYELNYHSLGLCQKEQDSSQLKLIDIIHKYMHFNLIKIH